MATPNVHFDKVWKFLSNTRDACNEVWYNVLYDESDQFSILMLHGIQHNTALFDLLTNGVHVLLSSPWYTTAEDIENIALPIDYDHQHYFHILANSEEEADAWRQSGFTDVITWNNACRVGSEMLSTDVPDMRPDERRFRAVCNSRLTKFKRHHLLTGIPGMAFVATRDKFGLRAGCKCRCDEICPACMHSAVPGALDSVPRERVFVDVSEPDVINILDNSEVGVIASHTEGACYASIEYLCRGLPVISTPSRGGRDFFYKEWNSIICEPSEQAINDAIERAIRKVRSGEFNREVIRRDAVGAVNRLIDVFIDVVQRIFNSEGVDCDARSYVHSRMDLFRCEHSVAGKNNVEERVKSVDAICKRICGQRHVKLMCACCTIRDAMHSIERSAYEALGMNPDCKNVDVLLERQPDTVCMDAYESNFFGQTRTSGRAALECNVCKYPVQSQVGWLLGHLGTQCMWGSQVLLRADMFGKNILRKPTVITRTAVLIAEDPQTRIGVAAMWPKGAETDGCLFYPSAPIDVPLWNDPLDPRFVLTIDRVLLWSEGTAWCTVDGLPIVPMVSRYKMCSMRDEIRLLKTKLSVVTDSKWLVWLAAHIYDAQEVMRRATCDAVGVAYDRLQDEAFVLPGSISVDDELLRRIEMAVFGQTDTPCRLGLSRNLHVVPFASQVDYLARYVTDEWLGIQGILSRVLTAVAPVRWMEDAITGDAVLLLLEAPECVAGLKTSSSAQLERILYPDSSSTYSNTFFRDSWFLVVGKRIGDHHLQVSLSFAPTGRTLLKYREVTSCRPVLCPWRHLDVGDIKVQCSKNFPAFFEHTIASPDYCDLAPDVGIHALPPSEVPASPFRFRFTYPHKELASWGHRAGWLAVMNSLNQMSGDVGPEILVIDIVEKTFSWDAEDSAPAVAVDMPFVCFWHNPPGMPEWFDYRHSPQEVLSRRFVVDALSKYCRGIFVFSDYLRDWLQPRVPPSIPVWSIPHPTDIDAPRWSLERFIKNPEPCVIQVGYWLRKMRWIADLDVPDGFRKLWLYGNPWAFDCMQRELFYEADEANFKDVAIAKISDKAYDRASTENIIALNVYDSSVNNAVIEAIVRCVPILINRHPAAIEYLGEAYPLFYETDQEAAVKLADLDLIIDAHEYLVREVHLRDRLRYSAFQTAISNILKSIRL